MSVKDEYGISARQRKFVDLVLAGRAAGRAYEQAGYSARGMNANSEASKLLKKPNISQYLKAERKKLAEASQIEKWELIEFLTRAIRTPIGELNQNDDLVQEVTKDEVGEQTIRTKIKMVGKLDAAKQLATLLNWNAPVKVEVDGTAELAELIGLVRKGGK